MTDSSRLMAKACHYYYRDQLTMSQIGERLGISRHRVGRLLREAVDSGVVRIEIRSPYASVSESERTLEQILGLKAAVVVDVDSELGAAVVKQQTCDAGATFLREIIKPHSTIGIGWGSTTFELVQALEPMDVDDVRVLQITGGNKWLSVRFDCHEVTRRLAHKLNVEPLLLHAPGIVDRRETRDLLLNESSIRESFQRFHQLDIAIVGIGAVVPSVQSTLISSGYISNRDLEALKNAGAVGDVFSYFFDAQGGVVRTPLYGRLITIGIDQVRRIPISIGVATGANKARAVAAAAKGGFVNTLVIDRELADAILAEHTPRASPGTSTANA